MIEEAIKGFRSGHERSTCSPAQHERNSSSPSAGLYREESIVVEGESSFAHQTLLASQITELNAVPDTQAPSVTSELANLRTIIKEHASPEDRNGDHDGRITDSATTYSHELPPSDVVLSMLSLIRGDVLSFNITVFSRPLTPVQMNQESSPSAAFMVGKYSKSFAGEFTSRLSLFHGISSCCFMVQ